jgi:hypothetical protein
VGRQTARLLRVVLLPPGLNPATGLACDLGDEDTATLWRRRAGHAVY